VNPRATAGSAQTLAVSVTWTKAEPDTLMERVLAPANLRRAYRRVVSNKSASRADGMTVDDLAGYVLPQRMLNELSASPMLATKD
jgi:RNA-directed DNA polymerase